jgi:hypothetical protein
MSQESLSQKFLKIKDSKLSPEEAYKILKDFNPDIHNNVDVINKPEPGQIYIFFTKDKLGFLRTVIGAKVGWGNSLGFCMFAIML